MAESTSEVPHRGRGQPAKPQTIRKRHNLGFRVNDAMRDRLMQEAAAAQRSISEEVEFQLQRARDLGIVLDSMFQDHQATAMFRDLSAIVLMVREIGVKRCFTEVEMREAISSAIDGVREVYCYVPGRDASKIQASDHRSERLDSSEESITNAAPAVLGYALAQHHLSNTERWEMAISGHVDPYWVR